MRSEADVYSRRKTRSAATRFDERFAISCWRVCNGDALLGVPRVLDISREKFLTGRNASQKDCTEFVDILSVVTNRFNHFCHFYHLYIHTLPRALPWLILSP